MNKHHRVLILGLVAILSAGISATTGWADDQGAEPQPAANKSTAPKQSGATKNFMGFPNFIQELRQTEGCLKAIGAKTFDGKDLVIAWFEDKAAAKRWYFGEMHQGMLDRFYPMRDPDREPLYWVPEDTGPIMTVASITRPKEPGKPISQLAIELYTPLHGGFAMGSLFGPDEFKEVFIHYDQYHKEEQEEQGDPSDSATEDKEGEAGY